MCIHFFSNFIDVTPLSPIKKKPAKVKKKVKSILKETDGEILLKPYLLKHSGSKGGSGMSSDENPVYRIQNRSKSLKNKKAKKCKNSKRVQFVLPAIQVEPELLLKEPTSRFPSYKTFSLSVPKMFTFHNKSLKSNDDLRSVKKKELTEKEADVVAQKLGRKPSPAASSKKFERDSGKTLYFFFKKRQSTFYFFMKK